MTDAPIQKGQEEQPVSEKGVGFKIGFHSCGDPDCAHLHMFIELSNGHSIEMTIPEADWPNIEMAAAQVIADKKRPNH